jgi:hypothetical protein
VLSQLADRQRQQEPEREQSPGANSVNMLKSKRFCTNPVSVEFENMTKLAGYKTDQRINLYDLVGQGRQ